MIKIERQYAITLAERGVEEYRVRAWEEDQRTINALVNNGLPTRWFIRRRFTWDAAVNYVKSHHSSMHRHLVTKLNEYKAFKTIFEKEQEDYILLELPEARKLIKFERHDDPDDVVYA